MGAVVFTPGIAPAVSRFVKRHECASGDVDSAEKETKKVHTGRGLRGCVLAPWLGVPRSESLSLFGWVRGKYGV